MTNKRYKEIISRWNPEEVIHIAYNTSYSVGMMEISCEFLIEKYKQLNKCFKDVEIRDIYIINKRTNVVYIHLNDLFNAWLYAIGRRYERSKKSR